MSTVIKAENLGKKYIIGHQKQRGGDSLRDAMTHTARGIWQRMRHPLSPNRESIDLEELWALKDVNFEVQQGERVGIIGANGAGKSTLLKVLSRITEPTTGRVRIKGRVSSLLEVGTGFHLELTGRENIFLNGAILGMTRQEVKRKFDEIIAFAELEKFLDTPVKRYSSGMYVRLAFAVAAHLEPEILIVDEVLAVGDASFQKKCLGKMENVAKQGRTILFVSHNMIAIQSLCRRTIWLDNGKIIEEGEPSQVVSTYLQTSAQESTVTERVWEDVASAPGNDTVRLHRVCVRPEDGLTHDLITMQTPLVMEFEFWNLVPDSYLCLNIRLIREQQVVAFASNSVEPKWWERPFPAGLFRSVCHIPGNLLNCGMHSVMVRVAKDKKAIYEYENALSFEVQELQDLIGRRGGYFGKTAGVVRPLLEWSTELVQEDSAIEMEEKE